MYNTNKALPALPLALASAVAVAMSLAQPAMAEIVQYDRTRPPSPRTATINDNLKLVAEYNQLEIDAAAGTGLAIPSRWVRC
ncbi:hypothetical protein HKW98_06340 [Stutzerimonas urumqiensis]|uniref:hypothetical protein n=1 Tax=Stutzerimonas urumqiensis TaxID=638269 RepID=UPI003BABECB6